MFSLLKTTLTVAIAAFAIAVTGPTVAREQTNDQSHQLVPLIAGHAGGMLNIVISSRLSKPSALVSGAVICAIRMPVSNSKNMDSEPWWFAAPLWVSRPDRAIGPGVSIFDLSIQGYSVERPREAEFLRHFHFVFEMARARGQEITKTRVMNGNQQLTLQLKEFLTSIVRLGENDSEEAEKNLERFDKLVNCWVQLKIASPGGQITTHRLPLTSAELVSWLGNYVAGEDKGKLLQTIEAL